MPSSTAGRNGGNMYNATARIIALLTFVGAIVGSKQNYPAPEPSNTLPPGKFLSFKQNDLSAAERYYATVDPRNQRLTLGQWWILNGFDATGGGGSRAAYLNYNDLGFGRDMHCLENSATHDIACYVTNYGQPDQSTENADLAWQADRARAGATVAMEYKAIEGSEDTGKIVKFFAFKGGTGDGERLLSVDLDGRGEKFLPGLCVVCHGGTYAPIPASSPQPSEADLGSSFREFDLSTYKYPADGPRSAQEKTFKKLNEIVVHSNPAPAIKDLIVGWYAEGGAQNSDYVPRGWAGEPRASLYKNVIARSCRTCHVALDSSYSNSVISWTSYDQFKAERSQIQRFVCGNVKTMPHSEVTFSNFWLSDSGRIPAQLAAFHDIGWKSFGECK